MTNHLTDEQWSAALLAEDDAAATLHLAGCNECRRELENMRVALAGARAESLAIADRPQLFWRDQRMAISSRIPAGPEIITQPLAWAGSLAVFALAAVLLTQSVSLPQAQLGNAQSSSIVSVQEDADHVLLMDIQRSVRRDVPRALEPATLIAQELHRAASKSDR
jgi:hypothetical protein